MEAFLTTRTNCVSDYVESNTIFLNPGIFSGYKWNWGLFAASDPCVCEVSPPGAERKQQNLFLAVELRRTRHTQNTVSLNILYRRCTPDAF